MNINNAILIGFDRSGTSAISRTLATHPQIELIFRPFNSGSIREKMYEILSEKNTSDEDNKFFKGLENNILWTEYINSQWHWKYSTVKKSFHADNFHVIITNLNHFSIEWLNVNFPTLQNWAIWRDPLEILQSCVENRFYKDWYTDALNPLMLSVKSNLDLDYHFGEYVEKLNNDVRLTAFFIGVRNYFLFKNINKGMYIDYDLFKSNPNLSLKYFLEFNNININYDFDPMLYKDLNSIQGTIKYQAGRKKQITISKEDLKFCNKLFEPLYTVFQNKRYD